MEVSYLPASSRIPYYLCSSSLDLHKRGGLALRSQPSICIGLTGKTAKPFPHRVRCQFQEDGGTIKVSRNNKGDVSTLEARCMDEVYDDLAKRLLSNAVISSPNFKYIVGLAGSPGSGKSTVASEVAQRINKMWPQKAPQMDEQVGPPEIATVLTMDGFHLYRHQLDAMEDPKEAHARRGAPWTFDSPRLLKCLQTLRNQGSVYAPSFDHGVGDPVEDDIFVSLEHKIVIVEGSYLFLEEGVWKDISTLFDEKWFIDVDIDTSMDRVLKRHISKSRRSPDEAKWRVEYNDRPNAEIIMKSKKNADLVIKSIDSSG